MFYVYYSILCPVCIWHMSIKVLTYLLTYRLLIYFSHLAINYYLINVVKRIGVKGVRFCNEKWRFLV